ncbi:MAG: UDP-glucose 4-epimerase GalE [Chloroflexota bacterium]
MNILVTGAAGYIGSVVTDELIKEGHRVIAVDNLVKGHLEAVHPEAIFIKTDIGDTGKMREVFKRYSPQAVMHLAALSVVSESMTDPERYFLGNVVSGMNLLHVMREFGVTDIVFSSSAAVYGNIGTSPVTEEAAAKPVSFYGESKLMFERLLSWWSYAYGLRYIVLRYFNVAGATDRLGEDHSPETHLILLLLKVALKQLPDISIFGTDYRTPDGTCIRDYVHVQDIARGHILALDSLVKGDNQSNTYNMGSEKGYSVLEVVRTTEAVTGLQVPVRMGERRAGDPPELIASATRIREELGWQMEYCHLRDIIATAWQWHKLHPYGYQG